MFFPVAESLLYIRIPFFVTNPQKKDKIGEDDLILSIREKQVPQTILIFMILYFMLIFDIKPTFNIYINIEKFITKLVINDSKCESKLLPKSLHW